MTLAPRRQTSRRSPPRPRTATSPASTWGIGGGLAGATEVSVRDECDEDGWVPSCEVAPLSWWFLVGLVSASAIFGISSLLVWVKRTVGQTVVFISSTNTVYIVFSLLMCYVRSSMMAELVGNFPADLAYSEFLLLPPELALNVTSLSGSEGNLGDIFWPSFGHDWFEFLLPLPMASCVAVSRLVISVSAWAA